MHILFVSEYFPPVIQGGGEINLFEVAKYLIKQGVKVSVLTSGFPGLPRREIMEKVQVCRCLNTSRGISSVRDNIRRLLFHKSVIRQTRKAAREIRPDIIHLIGQALSGAKKISRLGIPLAATIESCIALCPKEDFLFRGMASKRLKWNFAYFARSVLHSEEIGAMKNKWYLKFNPLFLMAAYWRYKKLNGSLKYVNCIAISEYIQNVLRVHGHKSTIIPNFISTAHFNQCNKEWKVRKSSKNRKIWKEEKGEKCNNRKKLLYLGSLAKFKGPQTVLKAIKGLDVHLDLYGRGVLKETLEKTIEQHGLDASVHDSVPYEKLPQIYANADITIFPSIRPEPFGRISIESMAAGTPVIGSRTGAIPETITPETGLLFSPVDYEELRKAIKYLLNNEQALARMGKAGKRRAKEFDEKKIIKRYLVFYNEISKANPVA